jgi:hypothetical protein
MFYVALNSATAVVIGTFVAVCVLRVAATPTWLSLTAVTAILLGFIAFWAWSDAMGMMNFQTRVPADKDRDGQASGEMRSHGTTKHG